MKLEELIENLELKTHTAKGNLDREVTGGYASDLLSCVMAKAEAGNVWITIQGHPNIVAVASLLSLAGIVVAEGMAVDPATIEKAQEENIPLLTTPLTIYTIAGRMYEMGVRGVD